MNNSFLLYTPFFRRQNSHSHRSRDWTACSTSCPNCYRSRNRETNSNYYSFTWYILEQFFLLWNNAHNFFYIISATATNISNQIPNSMGGQIVNVTDPDTGQTIQQVVQNTIDPKTGKTIQVTIPLNSIQNNGKLSKHLTYQFYINHIQMMCCETVLLIILHDDTFFYFCLSN